MLQLILIALAISHIGAWCYGATIYTDKDGKALSIDKALRESVKGETVYRCQKVAATVNKSGTSISFKVAK